jgi:hypothetical protein
LEININHFSGVPSEVFPKEILRKIKPRVRKTRNIFGSCGRRNWTTTDLSIHWRLRG